jgi:hypothetical protein
MNHKTTRQLKQLIKDERHLAATALLDARQSDGQPHLDRIEAAEKLISGRHAGWRTDAWVAFAVAGVTVLLVGALLVMRVGNTAVHFEGRVEAISILLPKGVHWSSASRDRLHLRSVDSVSQLWLPGESVKSDPRCGLTVRNEGTDVRLTELESHGTAWLTFRPTEGGMELQTEGAPSDYRFTGETAPATVSWTAGDPKAIAQADLTDEFMRARTACGGSSLSVDGGVFELDDAGVERVAFLRRGSEGVEVGGHVSSFLGGNITFFDSGKTAESLRSREQIGISKPTGRLTVRPDHDSLLVTFDGHIDNITLGPDQRSANPSRLAYMKNNQQLLLAGWALAGVWGLLWSARQLLMK